MGKIGIKAAEKDLPDLPTSIRPERAENGGLTRRGYEQVQEFNKSWIDRTRFRLGLDQGPKLSSGNRAQEYRTFLSANNLETGKKKPKSAKSDLRSAPGEEVSTKKTLLGV